MGNSLVPVILWACQIKTSELSNKVTTHENLETVAASEADALRCLSRKSAAELLDCHISYIDKLLASGKLKSRKLGPHITRIPLSEIQRFLSGSPAR
jgi:excisionase family DNA binding protein